MADEAYPSNSGQQRHSNEWLAHALLARTMSIIVDESFPEMDATCAASITVPFSGDLLLLAYYQPSCETSAVIRFEAVVDWSYGYPNDHGLAEHPLWGHGLKHYEFHVSAPDDRGVRCWIATFREGTLTVRAGSAEVLAEQLPLEPSAAIDQIAGAAENQRLGPA